jgi:hypothetical protein
MALTRDGTGNSGAPAVRDSCERAERGRSGRGDVLEDRGVDRRVDLDEVAGRIAARRSRWRAADLMAGPVTWPNAVAG